MKTSYLAIFLCALSFSLPSSFARADELTDDIANNIDDFSIIGGQAVHASSPYAKTTVLVRMWYGSERYLCSGTLLARDLVLTAAHCVINPDLQKEPTRMEVVFDPTAHPSKPENFTVEKWVVNPGYKDVADGGILGIGAAFRPIDDFALLRLARRIPYNNVVLAELPKEEVPAGTTEKLVLAGYGKTDVENNSSTGKLEIASINGEIIPVGSGDDLDYQLRITGPQPCNGDSGGSLLQVEGKKLILVGVTSNVADNCSELGTAMAVAFHLTWIHSTAMSLGVDLGD